MNAKALHTDKEREALALAERFGMRVLFDVSEYPLVRQRIRVLPYPVAKQHAILPIEEKEDGTIVVAMAKPSDLQALEEVRCLRNQPLEEVFCPHSQLEKAIERCYHRSDDEVIEGVTSDEAEEEIGDEYDLLDEESNSPVIRMLNTILASAIQQGASDIHFEPFEKGLVVRYRIDGVLQERHTPSRDIQNQLMTRIKVLAKLDIAAQRVPQDGRIKLRLGGREIDFRVSTVPVAYGERIVLRILDKGNITLGLNKIGMSSKTLRDFKHCLSQSQGIVLVTGPTGSGKTTTLYSGLFDIQTPEINIMTIEDPVEYKLPGMAQIGVNTKMGVTFAKGLRHILRQDPDVVMIGEIRDCETAEIAIQASLTGHLVLSTLHTNDAPSALTRLVDMGIEPYLLSSSVIAALAQRLVRRICPQCMEKYIPSAEELEELGLEPCKLSRGKGCNACFGSGYRGRAALYELMLVTTPIKQQLLKSADATQLQQVAISEGMVSLRRQGAELAAAGVTSAAEVLRVTRQIEV